jgi:hypothetical protein
MALRSLNPNGIGGIKAEGDNGQQDVDELDSGEEPGHSASPSVARVSLARVIALARLKTR